MDARKPRGFTLVELLVVIGIIGILLAMLTPAMDRAMYQADLTLCAAHQRAASSALISYAHDQRRQYPVRVGVRSDVAWNEDRMTLGRTHQSGRTRLDYLDERPPLHGYLPINATLNDPLCKKVDLETLLEDPTIFAVYGLWYGWQFAGEKGMFKIGDRFGWSYLDERANRVRDWKFSLLLGDLDAKTVSTTTYQTSHPDSAGVLNNVAFQNQSAGAQAGNGVFSWWTKVGVKRGDLDYNYAYDDGSVRRFVKVIDKDNIADGDPRMVHVKLANQGNLGWPDTRLYIPRE